MEQHQWVAISSYLIGTIWVVIWSTRRALGPTRGKFLQSDWVLAARLIYVFLHVVIFFGIMWIFIFGGEIGTRIADNLVSASEHLNLLNQIFDGRITPLAPVFSVVLMHLLLRFPIVDKLDRRVLTWLHSTEHLEDEMKALRASLETCPFEPNEIQVSENRDKLLRYDVRITDNRALSNDITFVEQWRKVSCLLRFVDEWQGTSTKVLDADEQQQLREIENTDRRKTEHFFDIIRALRHSGGQQLEDIRVRDPGPIARIGSRRPDYDDGSRPATEVVEYLPPARTDHMLEIATDELRHFVERIQGYFIEEYKILLCRVSSLAAKAIVYSGQEAGARLQKLKDAGYRNLGEIDRLTMDNIVKISGGTVLIVFAVFVIGLLNQNTSQINMFQAIFKIGLIYASAILCGAMIGSNRALAQQRETPWLAFAGAGLMSFLMFLFVHFFVAMTQVFLAMTQAFIQGVQDPGGAQGGDIVTKNNLPWALLPIAASVAVCRISRIVWPERFGRFLSRAFDGLTLAAVFIAVLLLVLAVHTHLGTTMGHRLWDGGALRVDMIFRVVAMSSVLGFSMGFLAIADIRMIARSKI